MGIWVAGLTFYLEHPLTFPGLIQKKGHTFSFPFSSFLSVNIYFSAPTILILSRLILSRVIRKFGVGILLFTFFLRLQNNNF